MWTWRTAKHFSIALMGGTVVLVGIALIVLPGPATVVIPLGLAILATEFVWARTLLNKLNGATLGGMANMVTGKSTPAPSSSKPSSDDAQKCDDQP